MEQREPQEKNANAASGAGQAPVDDTTGTERLNGEAPSPKSVGKRQVSLGQVVARFQAVRKALWDPTRSVRTERPAPLPTRAEAVGDESPQSEILTVDVARWVRRVLIPLAILAWAGVAILLLMAAGYVTKTLLSQAIAMLLAYALSPLVTLFTRVMPRFLAILIVYLLVLGAVGTLLSFIVRTAAEQVVSLANYLDAVLTPGKNGHPSALEQALRSLGISPEQIASARSQIVGQAEGLAGEYPATADGSGRRCAGYYPGGSHEHLFPD